MFDSLFATKTRSLRARPRLEALEERYALAVRVWDNDSGDGKWSTAANWSGDTLPTAADTAKFDGTSVDTSIVDALFAGTITDIQITSAYTGRVRLDRNLDVTTLLKQEGGDIGGSGDLTIKSGGKYEWWAGTMSTSLFAPGRTIIEANASLMILGDVGHVNNGRTISNSGTTTLSAGSLQLNFGALFDNLANGKFNLIASDGIDTSAGNPLLGLVQNNANATMSVQAGLGTTGILVYFNNYGTVEVEDGELALFQEANSLSTSTGTYKLSGVNPKLTLQGPGEYTFNNVTVEGGRVVTLGKLTLFGTVTVDSLTEKGDITGSGNLVIKSNLKFESGAMSSSGTTSLQANAGGTLDGTVTLARKFDNFGSFTVVLGQWTLANGAAITNKASAQFTLRKEATWVDGSDAATPATFTNSSLGTVTSDTVAADTIIIPVKFSNAGTLVAKAGTLRFSKDFIQTGGQVSLTGTLRSDGKVEIQGGLVVVFGNVAQFTAATGTFNSGTIKMDDAATPGKLKIVGDLTQNATGTLELRLFSNGTDNDKVEVTGQFTFGGKLKAKWKTVAPAALANFVALTYGSKAGTFTTLDLPAGCMFNPGATQGVINFAP